MEKQLGNSGKRKKPFWPKPAHQAQPRVPAPTRLPPLTGEWSLSTADCPALSSLSLTRCPVGPSCRRWFLRPRAPLPSLPRGPALPDAESLPCAPVLSLSLRCGPPLSVLPSPRPPWTSERALAHVVGILGYITFPTPQLLFEPRPCPHSLPHLISRSPAPTRALLMPPDLTRDPRPPPRPSSSPETALSHPELRPEVRHLCPCLVSPSSVVAVCRARAVTGQISLAQCPHVGP
jgi:hypothetical protein